MFRQFHHNHLCVFQLIMFSIFAKSWTRLSHFTFTFHFHNKISKTHFVEVYAGGSVVKNPLAKQEMLI